MLLCTHVTMHQHGDVGGVHMCTTWWQVYHCGMCQCFLEASGDVAKTLAFCEVQAWNEIVRRFRVLPVDMYWHWLRRAA